MVGRPACLWTCLSCLVKPVDLSNIKSAIYEKAWNKTHKHPATETIQCHLISQRALLQDESWICTHACRHTGVVLQPRCSNYTQVQSFSPLFCVKGFFICVPWLCERRTLAASKILPENGEGKQTQPSAFRSKLNRRTTVWPAVQTFCSSTDFT